ASGILVLAVPLAKAHARELHRGSRLHSLRVAWHMLSRGHLRVDEGPPDCGVLFRNKLEGDRAELRIAVIGVAVGIAQFHGFYHGVHVVGGVVPHGFEVKTLEQVQVLEKHWRLAPETYLVDVDPAIVRGQRLFDPGVVGGEIGFAEKTASLLAEIADAFCNRTTIEVLTHGLDAGGAAATRTLLLDFRHTLKRAV